MVLPKIGYIETLSLMEFEIFQEMARNIYNSAFRKKIIDDYKSGLKQCQLSIKYNIDKSIVSRVISKYRRFGTLETQHAGGRPRKTNQFTDRRIVKFVKVNPFASARDTIRHLELDVSESTVKRRLLLAGLSSYRAAKKPFISPKNRKARLEFAKRHLYWTVEQWRRILWSDESKFNLKGSDGKTPCKETTWKAIESQIH
jgi:transposase